MQACEPTGGARGWSVGHKRSSVKAEGHARARLRCDACVRGEKDEDSFCSQHHRSALSSQFNKTMRTRCLRYFYSLSLVYVSCYRGPAPPRCHPAPSSRVTGYKRRHTRVMNESIDNPSPAASHAEPAPGFGETQPVKGVVPLLCQPAHVILKRVERLELPGQLPLEILHQRF